MKKLKFIRYIPLPLITMVCMGMFSCSDKFSEMRPTDNGRVKGKLLSAHFGYLEKEVIPPVALSSDPLFLHDIMKAKKVSTTHLRDSIWADGIRKSSFYESTDMVITPSNASYIYPGSVLKASSIATDEFLPFLGYDLAPISVRLSFPSSLSMGTLPKPTLANSRIFLRDALMAPDFSGQNIDNFSHHVSYISNYKEVKLSYGYNVNETRLFSSTNSSFDYNSNNTQYSTKLTATYTVKNFTYNMSDPMEGELIDMASIPPNAFDGFSPVFINSLTYGRFGLLIVETNNNSSTMKSVFEKVIKKIFKQTSESFTQEETSLFSSCRVTIYLLGSTMGQSVTQLLINPNPEAISSFMSENIGVFTATDPGVPISFTAKYLKDNTPFKTIFKLDLPN